MKPKLCWSVWSNKTFVHGSNNWPLSLELLGVRCTTLQRIFQTLQLKIHRFSTPKRTCQSPFLCVLIPACDVVSPPCIRILHFIFTVLFYDIVLLPLENIFLRSIVNFFLRSIVDFFLRSNVGPMRSNVVNGFYF